MQKKAIAVNMMILLVLALIAMVIAGFLVARSSSTYTKSTSCESNNGKCVKATECNGKNSFLPGCKEDEVCCINEGE